MIGSVEKTMKILSVLSDETGAPARLSLIAQKTGFHKATCAHILETLVCQGYAEKISRSAGYILGPEIYLLTRYGKYNEELITLCKPIMRWLHKATDCAVVLAVLKGQKKYIIDYIDADVFATPMHIREDDIYRTATGKILLSHLSGEELRAFAARFGLPKKSEWKEFPSFLEFREELNEIRRLNYAKSTELKKGDKTSWGFAKGIFRRGNCIAALGVAGNHSKDELAAVLEKSRKALVKACNELNRRFDFNE